VSESAERGVLLVYCIAYKKIRPGVLHCSYGKCAGIYWVQRYDFFLKNKHFTNFLISNASFFHKNVIFVVAGAGKSDVTKCQGQMELTGEKEFWT